MAVQDDQREEFLRQVFDLVKLDDSGRSGTDAVLRLSDGRHVEFELKSTTRGSVTTARDFGRDHIVKWRSKHWLIGFFDASGTCLKTCVYVSPQQMEPWIREQEEKIRLDFEMSEIARKVHRALYEDVLVRNFGDKAVYTLEDAKRIQKSQHKESEYRARMDITDGFSKDRMLNFLTDRWVYLTKRGSTLNNPHIPAKYFDGFTSLPLPESGLPLVMPTRVVKKARDTLVSGVQKAVAAGEDTHPAG